jgi:hypothetical protein
MNTTLSSKLAALMLALAINSVILGGVALMFNTRAHDFSTATVAAMRLASDRSIA